MQSRVPDCNTFITSLASVVIQPVFARLSARMGGFVMKLPLTSVAVGSLLLLTGAAPDAPATKSWLQFNAATQTTDLTASNVRGLKLFRRFPLSEVADTTPLYVGGARLADGSTNDVLIVETKTGRVIAMDAEGGAELWSTTPPKGPRWTTSTPAVDPNHLYVYAYCLDGYIHKYAIADGSEITGDGWPELVTLKGAVEKGSSALSIATAGDGVTYLYATIAAYPEPGDDGDYQGHLVTINLATGAQNVFNGGCSDKQFHFVENGNETNDCGHTQGGIWGRAGAVYDRATDRVFITTGNGIYDADRGGYNWASTIVALRPDGSSDGGTPLDSYTPTEYEYLNVEDLDLSSASVAIIPSGAKQNLPPLGVQGGKDQLLRLVDLSNLSGQSGPRHLGGELDTAQIPQGGNIVMHPATWLQPSTQTAWIFVTNFRGIAAFTVDRTSEPPQLVQRWWRKEASSSAIVVNNVLYYAGSSGMQAVNPVTGDVLWQDRQIANVHWQSPTVINGNVYILDEGGYLAIYKRRVPNGRKESSSFDVLPPP
jgi:hypothetical protein